jgi:hypothetical protein
MPDKVSCVHLSPLLDFMRNQRNFKRPKPFTQREIELDELLNAEKQSTGKFYYQMSTTGISQDGKEKYLEHFERMSARIKVLQSQENADWLSALPLD